MDNNKSIKSTVSTSSVNRNKVKICGACGKKETGDFVRHCKTKHDGKQIIWTEG
jgi:hypothetical protein